MTDIEVKEEITKSKNPNNGLRRTLYFCLFLLQINLFYLG